MIRWTRINRGQVNCGRCWRTTTFGYATLSHQHHSHYIYHWQTISNNVAQQQKIKFIIRIFFCLVFNCDDLLCISPWISQFTLITWNAVRSTKILPQFVPNYKQKIKNISLYLFICIDSSHNYRSLYIYSLNKPQLWLKPGLPACLPDCTLLLQWLYCSYLISHFVCMWNSVILSPSLSDEEEIYNSPFHFKYIYVQNIHPKSFFFILYRHHHQCTIITIDRYILYKCSPAQEQSLYTQHIVI